MIDSINIILKIKYWHYFVTLKKLGIVYKKLPNKQGIKFNYKGITFEYRVNRYGAYLTLKTIAGKILKKDVVELFDMEEYKKILKLSSHEILEDVEVEEIYLGRIDFKVDIKMSTQLELNTYINLLKKHISRYKYMRKYKSYATSIHISTSRSKGINMYDREEKTKNAVDKLILRIEVQVKKDHIKKLRKEGAASDINNYWTIEAMQKLYFDFLTDYLYTSDYYRLDIAKQKIKASNYKVNKKKRLISFITSVNKYGITAITKEDLKNDKKSKRKGEKRIYAHSTVIKYSKILQEIGIELDKFNGDREVIVLSEEIIKNNSELNIAIEQIHNSKLEEKTKNILVEFIMNVYKYGLNSVDKYKVNKIKGKMNSKNEYSGKRKYCEDTIEDYIKKIQELGINPVTINIDSKFEMLPNLLNRAKVICEKQYWK